MRRDFVPDSLMTSPVVVIINKVRNSTPQCDHVILRVQVDIFSLNGPSKAFYPDIVKALSSAIHTNLYSIRLTSFQPLLADVLAPLVGVDDFWCTMFLNRPFQKVGQNSMAYLRNLGNSLILGDFRQTILAAELHHIVVHRLWRYVRKVRVALF